MTRLIGEKPIVYLRASRFLFWLTDHDCQYPITGVWQTFRGAFVKKGKQKDRRRDCAGPFVFGIEVFGK